LELEGTELPPDFFLFLNVNRSLRQLRAWLPARELEVDMMLAGLQHNKGLEVLDILNSKLPWSKIEKLQTVKNV